MKKIIIVLCISLLLLFGGCNKRKAGSTSPSEQATQGTHFTVENTESIIDDIPVTVTEESEPANTTTEVTSNTEPPSTGKPASKPQNTSSNDNNAGDLPSTSSEPNSPQESITETESTNSGNTGAESFDADMDQSESGNIGAEIFD